MVLVLVGCGNAQRSALGNGAEAQRTFSGEGIEAFIDFESLAGHYAQLENWSQEAEHLSQTSLEFLMASARDDSAHLNSSMLVAELALAKVTELRNAHGLFLQQCASYLTKLDQVGLRDINKSVLRSYHKFGQHRVYDYFAERVLPQVMSVDQEHRKARIAMEFKQSRDEIFGSIEMVGGVLYGCLIDIDPDFSERLNEARDALWAQRERLKEAD